MEMEPYHLAVTDDTGNITINSFQTGSLLFTLSHALNKFADLTQMKFICHSQSSHLYLSAVSASGTVYFYSRPVPSSHYKKASKGSNTVQEKYLCETQVKRNVHKGDILAIAACELYIAIGGLDSRVSFWNAQTGAMRNFLDIPPSKVEQSYIQCLNFVTSNYFLVITMSSGETHLAHPSASNILA